MRKQYKGCPWKVSTVPSRDIETYCATKHRKLKNTIAKLGDLNLNGTLYLMACHETSKGKERPCVGWLAHQLGPGNNLALRLHVMRNRELADFELIGEQHERFEDTL